MASRIKALCLLFLASAAILAAMASPAKALPENFFGLSSGASYWASAEDWNVLGHSGAKVFRMQLNWGQIVENGNWETPAAWAATYDNYVAAAAYNGMTVLPYIYGRKDNSSRYYKTSESGNWAAWLEFVRTAVQRYGYNGSFWSAHPEVPYKPVRVWEVWNEPNLNVNNPQYWNGTKWVDKVDPELYAKFFTPSAVKIHQAQDAVRKPGEPNNTIVLLGGLYQNTENPPMNVGTFLQQATKVPGFEFEALSLHPYSFNGGNLVQKYEGMISNIEQAREALDIFATPTTPIWITELGWPRAGVPSAVDEAGQASLLNMAFTWIKANYAKFNIQHLAWFFYRDTLGSEKWDSRCGLRSSTGEFLESWFAYQQQAGVPLWSGVWRSEDLGGYVTSAPDVASWSPGRLDVFVKGAGESLVHRYFQGGWGEWEDWGGALASGAGPGAVSWGPGRIDIFGRAPNGNLLTWAYEGKLTTGNLGGLVTSDPDVASWSPGRLDVFVKGAGEAMVHRYFQGGWGGWEDWGGTLAAGAGPGAVSWGPGRIDIFGRAPNSSLASWYWDGALHTGNLGGAISSDPDVASWGPGRLDVFARGTDNTLQHKYYANGSWSSWESLGGSLSSAPGAVAWEGGRLDVFARDADGSLLHWWLSP